MDLSILLPDSEVAAVTAIDPDLWVRFSAAALLKRGAANADKAVQGFGRGVVLQLQSAQVAGQEDPQLGRIAAGRLQLAGQWYQTVPVPFEFKGPVHLELAFANRAYLVASGTGIRLRFEAGANFAESLAC